MEPGARWYFFAPYAAEIEPYVYMSRNPTSWNNGDITSVESESFDQVLEMRIALSGLNAALVFLMKTTKKMT